MNDSEQDVWHILDVGSIWMKEFAAALSRVVPTIAWSPRMAKLGMFYDWQQPETIENPRLQIRHFPLQRGYARAPLRWMVPFEKKLLDRLAAQSYRPEESPLVCSTPFYAPVAEQWPGPVIFYVTDLTYAYDGLNPVQVKELDRRMCQVATAVCPNSRRIANYLVAEAGCDPTKITIVPNATRESNIAPAPLLEPGARPEDIRDISRPIAGVVGDLAGNMDWKLLAEVVQRTPELAWVFVGPATRTILDGAQSKARECVMAAKGVRFVGAKPYGELQAYARSFNVAVLPYLKKEPTYSGSSTRFYEHVAACRPMIGTHGFAELMEKEPLITLVDTADEVVAALRSLEAIGFTDGLERARWDASRTGTWEERARVICGVLPASKISSERSVSELA